MSNRRYIRRPVEDEAAGIIDAEIKKKEWEEKLIKKYVVKVHDVVLISEAPKKKVMLSKNNESKKNEEKTSEVIYFPGNVSPIMQYYSDKMKKYQKQCSTEVS